MNTQRKQPRTAGFTLAEMMVVIVILGLLATLVVPNVLKRLGTAMTGKVKADITTITSSLDDYAVANGGKFPDSLEALVTPDVNGHTYLKGLKTIPLDPWKNEYLYEPPSPGRPNPRVYSLGKDGQQGGEGDDADIDNETIQNEEKK
jgi:general secretion pathway protein G